jgi:hypothetical protein
MTVRRIAIVAAAVTGGLLLAAPARADIGLNNLLDSAGDLTNLVPLEAVVDPAVDLGFAVADLF